LLLFSIVFLLITKGKTDLEIYVFLFLTKNIYDVPLPDSSIDGYENCSTTKEGNDKFRTLL